MKSWLLGGLIGAGIFVISVVMTALTNNPEIFAPIAFLPFNILKLFGINLTQKAATFLGIIRLIADIALWFGLGVLAEWIAGKIVKKA